MMNIQASTDDARTHAIRAREAKRREAEAIGVDERFISDMVEGFYASIREDDLLGPIFAQTIDDWPPHLARMKQFWRSILHNSGEFSGNPMARHKAIPGLGQHHFARWLDLFYANLRSLAPNPRAQELVAKRARMIAESLLTGIVIDRDGLAVAMKKGAFPMFEEQADTREFDTAERLEDLLPAITIAREAQARVQPEQRGFELPPRIWAAMIVCYVLFMTAMAVALNSSGKAMLSILVAAVYIAVFFGAALVVMRQNPAREESPLDRTGSLGTLYGPLEKRAVYGQILIVPVAVALFGIAVAAIIAALGSSA